MQEKSEKEILNEFYHKLIKIETLYKTNCVNRLGKTKKSKKLYTEIIAKELLKNLNTLNKISSITRGNSYCRKTHCQIRINNCNSNRNEENFAKRITGLSFPKLGKILDYQIPLQNTRANKKVGKIDLISYHSRKKTLFIIELKYGNNNDTLLKALLEIYTYYKIVNTTKLLNDCKTLNNLEQETVIIKPAVLLTKKCQAYSELQELLVGKRPILKKLITKLGIKIFTLDFTDQMY